MAKKRILAYRYPAAGALRVTGADAGVFLQGQFSADLLKGPLGSCIYGLWLSRKGKIQADSYALREGENSFLIVCLTGGTTEIRNRLESHIIMDEVELEDVVVKAVAVLVPEASAASTKLFAQVPERNRYTFSKSVYEIRLQLGERSAFLLLAQGEQGRGELTKRLDAAEQSIKEICTEEFAGERLESGAFEVGADILESDLPQEVGLAQTAVDYNKGCYLGQEVMARLKSMGRQRRCLRVVTLDEAPTMELPAILVDEAGAKRGELRSVATRRGSYLGSAMVGIEVASPLRLLGPDDRETAVAWNA